MKKYNITVNGNLYEVVVEEVSDLGGQQTSPVQQAPAAAPVAPKAAQIAKKPTPPAAASAAAGSVKIAAPMPGTIIKINVEVGQKVTSGEALCVLEAMKMENDIPAPADGTVASINVTKGSAVNSGDLLFTLD